MDESFGSVMPETRAFAERGLAETRRAYERSLVAGERAFNNWEDLMALIMGGARELNHKLLANSDTNIRAVFSLAERLVRARSLQESYEIQQVFVREQTDRLVAQMTELEQLTARQIEACNEQIGRARGLR